MNLQNHSSSFFYNAHVVYFEKGPSPEQKSETAKADPTIEARKDREALRESLSKGPSSYASIAHYPPLSATVGKSEYMPPFARGVDTEGLVKLNTRENPEEKEGRAAIMDAGAKYLQLYQYDPQAANLREALDQAIQQMINVERDPTSTEEERKAHGRVLKQNLDAVRAHYYDPETERLRLPILQIPAAEDTKPMRNQLRTMALDFLRVPQSGMTKAQLDLRTPANLKKIAELTKACTALETGELYRLPGTKQEELYKISTLNGASGFKIYADPKYNFENSRLTDEEKKKNPPLTAAEKLANVKIAAGLLLTALASAGWTDKRDFNYPLDLRDSPTEAEERRLALAHKDAGKSAPIPFMNRREALFNNFIDKDGIPVAGRVFVQTAENYNYYTVPKPSEEK